MTGRGDFMRIVFMGTPDFAVPSLDALAQHHEVVGVFTRPDRIRGRGKTPTPSPVKARASELGLQVYEPVSLRGPEVVETLSHLRPDVICVAAYGAILPPAVLEIPPYGCINVHASLLPRHRGAAPIHRAILEGDALTGVSIMRMEEGLDTGPYSATCTVEVQEKTTQQLEEELASCGARLLIETLEEVAQGTVVWIPQDESVATHAPKVTREDVALHPGLDVASALRRVRASTSSARCKLCIDGCEIEITRASAGDVELAPGEAHADKSGLYLGFSDGSILAAEVRPPGRPCMDGCAWVRGARIDSANGWHSV